MALLSATPLILLAAQATWASVAGVVKDRESGEPIAGATVSLVDLDRAVPTDSAGRYLLPDVPAGPQHMVVRQIGYAQRTFHALVPRQGALEIDVALRREPIPLEPIEVRSAVPVRGLEGDGATKFLDRHLSVRAVRHHPLLSEPDVLQAAGGGEVALRPESPSGIHVRGGASDQVAYLLDGIPVLNPYHAAGTFGAWNPDALSRLDLFTSTLPPEFPDALSGAMSATTRTPGARHLTQGSVSTSQARLTLDGPLGFAGAGYLLSLRSQYPGLLGSKHETSHIRGDGDDWLGKVDTPLLGGRLGLLGYGSATEIRATASEPDPGAAPADPVRNALTWESTSLGGGWTLPLRQGSLRLRAWSAVGDAGVTWAGQDSAPAQRLDARRRDEGAVAMVELPGAGTSTAAGFRVLRSRTTYRVRSVSGESTAVDLDARTPVSAAFVQHQRSFAGRGEVELSLASALAVRSVYLDPGVRIRWKASDAWTLSWSGARRHQFAQSLRNPESFVGNIFPADLYLGAGGEVPVARSDLGIVGLEHRPAAGLLLGAQGYVRSFRSLVLVAPQNGDPFATSGFVRGSGEARGAAFQAAANGTRYGVIADYGFQRVRLDYAEGSYVPDHGAAHSIDAGVIVFPSVTSSVRLGVSSAFGRRGTAVLGPVEWEACNLLDRGCEFAGSPADRSGPLGGTRLPAYLRVDLGIRKHWHVVVLGRDVQVALFGAATNLLGRKNVLTVALDPSTGEHRQIEMRPRSPLVVGMDWRF